VPPDVWKQTNANSPSPQACPAPPTEYLALAHSKPIQFRWAPSESSAAVLDRFHMKPTTPDWASLSDFSLNASKRFLTHAAHPTRFPWPAFSCAGLRQLLAHRVSHRAGTQHNYQIRCPVEMFSPAAKTFSSTSSPRSCSPDDRGAESPLPALIRPKSNRKK